MPSLLDRNGFTQRDPAAEASELRRKQQEALMREREQQTQNSAASAQREADKANTEHMGATMKTDALQWAGDKAHPQYHVAWDALPEEAKQHFLGGAYGDAAAKAPETYNAAFTQQGGLIPGLEHLVESGATTDEQGNTHVQRTLRPTITPTASAAAARMGVKVTPEMTPEDLQIAMADSELQRQHQKEAKDVFSEDAKKGMEIDRTKRMVQTNPQVRFYQGARANYDSIEKNINKPNRTGADDAFLAQAAATMEAPGRSPTGHDIAIFLQSRGIQGNLEVLGGKIQSLVGSGGRNQAGRIFDDQTAKDIAMAAKNALQTRRESLTEAMAPHVYRFEQLGEDPYHHLPKSLVDDVYGVKEGEPAVVAKPEAEQAATNPKTGERIVLRNGQWVPLK